MAAPVRQRSVELAALEDLQAQVAALARARRNLERRKARGRGRQRAYAPPDALPGPKPSELDVARAQRLWRGIVR